MSQSGGGAEHKGLLFRGADGSLWFIRDDANRPEKVPKGAADRINKHLQNVSQTRKVAYSVPQGVIDELNKKFGRLHKEGVIHQIHFRPPKDRD
jgi:hypothetical protein